MMKPIKITVPWVFGQYAMTVWPFVFVIPAWKDDKCLWVHEMYHWREQWRWLVIPWLVVYLVQLVILGLILRRPADKLPMEREAYRLSRECEAQDR